MNFHESLICCSRIFMNRSWTRWWTFMNVHSFLFTNIHELFMNVHEQFMIISPGMICAVTYWATCSCWWWKDKLQYLILLKNVIVLLMVTQCLIRQTVGNLQATFPYRDFSRLLFLFLKSLNMVLFKYGCLHSSCWGLMGEICKLGSHYRVSSNIWEINQVRILKIMSTLWFSCSTIVIKYI